MLASPSDVPSASQAWCQRATPKGVSLLSPNARIFPASTKSRSASAVSSMGTSSSRLLCW